MIRGLPYRCMIYAYRMHCFSRNVVTSNYIKRVYGIQLGDAKQVSSLELRAELCRLKEETRALLLDMPSVSAPLRVHPMTQVR